MKKKFYFGSNLKMYKTVSETLNYLQTLSKRTKDIPREDFELFILPSYTSLERAGKEISSDLIRLGAQNISWEENGQFTGEISPRMLQETNTSLVMIGHSERRHLFRETNEEENKKVRTCLAHGFQTLLCIGETEAEKEYGISNEVLRTQLKIGLHQVKLTDLSKLWIAYEPVWSIGVNGTPAPPSYAESMHQIIRTCLLELFGEAAHEIPLFYGGSVNPQNANELIVQPSIDGLFIGRSAWNAEAFYDLILNAMHAKNQKEEALI